MTTVIYMHSYQTLGQGRGDINRMMNVKRWFLASDISCTVSLEISITSSGVSQKISQFLVTVLQVFLMESKDSDQLSITTNFDASKAQLLPRFLNQLQT